MEIVNFSGYENNYVIVSHDTQLFGYITKELPNNVPYFVLDDVDEEKIVENERLYFRHKDKSGLVHITTVRVKMDMYEKLCYIIKGNDPRSFIEYIDSKYDLDKVENDTVFDFDQNRNAYYSSPYKSTSSKLYGYEEYFSMIGKEIKAITDKKELLLKLGAHSGHNHLLYGPPGVGKSTFVKQIARLNNLPIFIVKLQPRIKNLADVLSPKYGYTDGATYNVNGKPCIILLEDFDRYLSDSNNEKVMSDLLNALDGVLNCYGVLRFFSANDMTNIIKNEALMSRMGTILHFDIPTPTIISDCLSEYFPEEKESVPIFLKAIEGKGLTIRKINSFLQKFALEEKPLAASLLHLDKLFEEMRKLDDMKKVAESS